VAGFLKLTWMELKLFVRDPFATVFALVFPLIMLMLLAAVFGGTPTEEDVVDGVPIFRGVPGDDYYVAASVALVIAVIGLLTLPTHLAGYREQGVLRRFRASSIPTWTVLASQFVVGLAIAVAGTALMLMLTVPVYDTAMPSDPLGVAVAFLLAALCFTAIGFLLAAIFPTARAAQGVGLILFFVVWMLSGTGPPRAVLPDGARTIGRYEPLTHTVIAIQDPWFGFGWNAGKLGIVAAVTVVAAALALWRFRWD
jgi:ABC-2 type transport system permease protein